MKSKSEPQFAVIEGGKTEDALSVRNNNCTDYYDVFTDPSGVIHYKPGGYYYRSEFMGALLRGDVVWAKGIAFGAFRELEILREWVNNTVGVIPARWTTTPSENEAKTGLHPDFTETPQETPHAS